MPRKMRSSFGCVQRLAQGHYRLRWWEEVGGEYKRRSENVRGTRREAERRLAEIRVGLDENKRHRLRQVPTVAEAYERWWLPEAEQAVEAGKLARSTCKCRLSKWRKYVGPRWGEVKVTDIEPLDVQEWLLTMTKKPASDSLAMLRKILDYCQLYDLVQVNVARRPYRMPEAHETCADGAYTLAELDRIARAAHGSPCEAAMILSMFGSARTGESLGVRLDEVSRAEHAGVRMTVAQVVRQVHSDGKLSADGDLKNRQSVRPLVVPEPWGDRLWEIAEERRAAGDVWLSDDGLWRPMSQNAYRREWARACEAAGVEPKQARAARRSWETYMRWDMEVDRSKIEQMMGHALPGVTGEHYDKPTAPMFVRAVGEAFARKPFMRDRDAVPGT
jgi:integrase